MKPAVNPEAEWFGYERIKPEEKTSRVGQVFASVASNYDLMNDLMSGGLHRLWKDRFVGRIHPRAGQKILDVAGGTGDIALRLLRASKGEANITVSDINPAMLEIGKAKAIDQGIGISAGKSKLSFQLANAEDLPFPKRSFDVVTIAFGLRNVTRIDQALREFHRVLKPGGRLFILEFSPGVAKPLQPIYQRYCFSLLPALGKYVAKDEAAYRYLAESIQQFPTQKNLADRMTKAGFQQVNWLNFSGGICAMHEGWRL